MIRIYKRAGDEDTMISVAFGEVAYGSIRVCCTDERKLEFFPVYNPTIIQIA